MGFRLSGGTPGRRVLAAVKVRLVAQDWTFLDLSRPFTFGAWASAEHPTESKKTNSWLTTGLVHAETRCSYPRPLSSEFRQPHKCVIGMAAHVGSLSFPKAGDDYRNVLASP